MICHVASSQPRKEWPLSHWAAFHRLATTAGYSVVFTTARGEREAALMADLKSFLERTGKMPVPLILPQISELPLFLAVLARAAAFRRRAGRADDFAVWSDCARTVGADRRTAPDFDRRGLRVRRQFRHLHGCAPLPGGDFPGARNGGGAKDFRPELIWLCSTLALGKGM